MAAKYDWLKAYAAAETGEFGDNSDPLSAYNNIIKAAGSDYTDAQKAGIITADGSVDWSKAPKDSAPNAPANSQWITTGGRAGMTDAYGKAATSGYGGTQLYNDPNYGTEELVQERAPDSTSMKIARGVATAAVAGPAAAAFAPLIGGALGLGAGANTSIAALLKAIPGLAMSGGQNWASTLGSILGGASGIPGGSTIGGAVGSYAQMTPAQRAQLNQLIGGH